MNNFPHESIVKATLLNMQREYPHAHTGIFASRDDFKSPRQAHPIFYGCFDWHSSVHSHWLLVRILDISPPPALTGRITSYLNESFTADKVSVECEYFNLPYRESFERPYGWAWTLKLYAQLKLSKLPEAARWSEALLPLTNLLTSRTMSYLPKLNHPIRSGQHNNTAFALLLMLEFALTTNNTDLASLIKTQAKTFYLKDVACPSQEPGGEDFLSPTLQTALLMQQILPPRDYHRWFNRFLPPDTLLKRNSLTTVVEPSDRTDGRLAHLDGLNLSRSWCMRRIAGSFPAKSNYFNQLNQLADQHLNAGRTHLHDDYMGEHWLATFLLLALYP